MNTSQNTVPILDGLTPPKNPEVKKEWFEQTSGVARDGIVKFIGAFRTRIFAYYILIAIGILAIVSMIFGLLIYLTNKII